MATPHISAEKNQIAKIVLMAGDPLRAKKFAETYLENIELVNEVRNMLAFTGTIDGKRVTVMGHGMGLESIGIYAFELYEQYEVDTIIRFGSCGSYNPEVNLGDLIIAEKTYTESNFGIAYGETSNLITAKNHLLDLTKKVDAKGFTPRYSTVDSSIWFYKTTEVRPISWFQEQKIDVVEMETYALYVIANALNKQALTILTVSDSLVTNESMSAIMRQDSFTTMFAYLKELIKEL